MRLTLARWSFAAGLALLAAPGCGDDDGGDADGGDVVDAPTTEVTVHAAGNALVAIRETGGAWRALTPDAAGDVVAEVGEGPFEVASVCVDPDLIDFLTVLAVTDVDREVDVACAPDDDEWVLFAVNGPTDASYVVGDAGSVVDAGVELRPGRYDVVVYEHLATPPRGAIFHDVEITSDTWMEVDLEADGVELRPVTVDLGIAAPITVAYGSLRTARGTRHRRDAVDDVVYVFPADELADGDSQEVAAVEQLERHTRTVSRRLGDETAVSLALPPHLTDATATLADGGLFEVTWAPAGTHDQAYASAWVALPVDRILAVEARSGFMAATGATSLATADPTALPGWDPAWDYGLDLHTPFQLTVVDGDGEVTTTAAVEGAARAPRRAGR